MTGAILRTQQRFERNLSGDFDRPDMQEGSWVTLESIGKLIDFYSAMWGHLNALDDEMRWTRSLPPQPYEQRMAELRQLQGDFLETHPPDWIKEGLQTGLQLTLDLAAAFQAQAAAASPDRPLRQQIQKQRDLLGKTLDELLRQERLRMGPVLAISLAERSKTRRRDDRQAA